MVSKAKVGKMHSIPTYTIVWLVCLSSILSMTIKNIQWSKKVSNLKESKRAATFIFEMMTYAAILFVLYHLYRINDNTMQLAIQIETVKHTS